MRSANRVEFQISEEIQIPRTNVILEKGDRGRIISEARALDLKWRAFSRYDWDGFSGAESFQNGDEPLIAEAPSGLTVLIIDAQGIEIIQYSDESGLDMDVWTLEFEDAPLESASEGWEEAESYLKQISLPVRSNDIKRMRFVQMM